MKLLIKNGRIIDAATNTDRIGSIYIEDNIIKSWDEETDENDTSIEVIDASGYCIMPGLIDMHVHLRDPGQTWKEDVFSGADAAAKGGFTTIIAMPNTTPVIDDKFSYSKIAKKEADACVHIIQAGAVTKDQEGKELSDIKGMKEAGAIALSEDGKSVMNAGLFRQALRNARRYDMIVLDHCEDKSLVDGGCVNLDAVSRKEGLPGISNSVEDVITVRDLMLAGETGARLHLCHMSTKDSVLMLKEAKERGFRVSGEVCPHHLVLTSSDRKPGDTNYKMNPPVRTEEDRQNLILGLASGVIDVISTDHAPHRSMEKDTTMVKAPFGIVGLETAAELIWTKLVCEGILTPLQMVEKMSFRPAQLLGLDKRGSIYPGSEADLIIWDPDADITIDPETFVSKSKNTPFGGWKVKGEVLMTICAGKIVYAVQRGGNDDQSAGTEN